MTPEKPNLEALIREAKDARLPEVDWSKVEAKLFPRVEREASARAALERYAGARRVWVGAAVTIALAASVPLFFARGPGAALDAVTEYRQPSAGTLESKAPSATAHVTRDGITRELTPGSAIARGDLLDARGGRAVFTRGELGGRRSVTWALEDGALVDVRSARGTLILALTKGAVEAQVTPVANGEAFAIDVEGTRVAVHGTHLRVERQGARAIVDLREGVVSIGVPPKSGATYGDLVNAPAHVEFDSADPHGTLKVTHEADRVRAQGLETPPEVGHKTAQGSDAPAPRPSGATGAPLAAPIAVAPAKVTAPPAPPPPPASAPTPSAVSSPVPPPPEPTQVDLDPEHAIAEAVRTCARAHVVRANGVVITVSSRLELRIKDSGMVETARFEPPLAPEVQSCAAQKIYGTRFSQPGAVSIPIDFTP